MSDVSSLTQDPFFSEYSPHGRDFGHPVMNLLMRSTFGYNYAPKPQDGQGMYDAYMQRERSREFYDIQKDSFANNMLFKAGGVDSDNALLQFGASALSSPDGLAEDGLVEIKCPNTATHLEYLMEDVIPGKYKKQMAFQMACTGAKWCDFVSFDPRLPPRLQMFCTRLARDDLRIKAMEGEVIKFIRELEDKIAALNAAYPEAVAA